MKPEQKILRDPAPAPWPALNQFVPSSTAALNWSYDPTTTSTTYNAATVTSTLT